LELMTPVDYILRESKNCNMWWTHTDGGVSEPLHLPQPGYSEGTAQMDCTCPQSRSPNSVDNLEADLCRAHTNGNELRRLFFALTWYENG
ncbi:hypothetical protein, partial [Enterobacter hormaechei]